MKCKICKKVFPSQATFLSHCRDEHKTADGVTRYTCTFDDVCERQFSYTDSFRHHLREHMATQPPNSSQQPPNSPQHPSDSCQQPTNSIQQSPGSSRSYFQPIDEESSDSNEEDDVVENFSEPFADLVNLTE